MFGNPSVKVMVQYAARTIAAEVPVAFEQAEEELKQAIASAVEDFDLAAEVKQQVRREMSHIVQSAVHSEMNELEQALARRAVDHAKEAIRRYYSEIDTSFSKPDKG